MSNGTPPETNFATSYTEFLAKQNETLIAGIRGRNPALAFELTVLCADTFSNGNGAGRPRLNAKIVKLCSNSGEDSGILKGVTRLIEDMPPEAACRTVDLLDDMAIRLIAGPQDDPGRATLAEFLDMVGSIRGALRRSETVADAAGRMHRLSKLPPNKDKSKALLRLITAVVVMPSLGSSPGAMPQENDGLLRTAVAEAKHADMVRPRTPVRKSRSGRS